MTTLRTTLATLLVGLLCAAAFLLTDCEKPAPAPDRSAVNDHQPPVPPDKPAPYVFRGKMLDEFEPGTKQPYQLYLPEGYHPGRQWPMVVLLFGRGLEADELARAIGDWQKSADREGRILLRPAAASDLAAARPCIGHTLGRWSIDRSRLSYVTGPDAAPSPLTWP